MDRTAYQKVLAEAFERHYREGSDVWSSDCQSEETTRLALQAALRHTGRPSLEVLDIGCGNGRHVREFAGGTASRYVGVDLYAHDDWPLRAAEAEFPVRFVQSDFLAWAKEDETLFDLILDCGCFHHQHPDDQGVYLQEVARKLRPDGLFSAVVWAEPFREGNVDDYGRYHFYFSPQSIGELLARHGLRAVEVFESTAKIGKRQLQILAQRNGNNSA
jgi:SAM-dependent methyltransferase